MRRNITFIELIIILCIITATARVGKYKLPESKSVPTPAPIHRPTQIYVPVNECPRCGSSNGHMGGYMKEIDSAHGKRIRTWDCEQCNYSYRIFDACPKCFSSDIKFIPPTDIKGRVYYMRCNKCGWSWGIDINKLHYRGYQ